MTIKSTSQNNLAFNKHFDDLIHRYNRVYVLNLLSQSKLDEEKLSQTMNNLLEMRNDKNISSYNYDFHRELGNDNYDNISGLLNIIRPNLDTDHLFIHNRETNKSFF